MQFWALAQLYPQNLVFSIQPDREKHRLEHFSWSQLGSFCVCVQHLRRKIPTLFFTKLSNMSSALKRTPKTPGGEMGRKVTGLRAQ